ncbi:MAG: hypothetical protein AAFV25_06380 [Bacteroidota bacterium]
MASPSTGLTQAGEDPEDETDEGYDERSIRKQFYLHCNMLESAIAEGDMQLFATSNDHLQSLMQEVISQGEKQQMAVKSEMERTHPGSTTSPQKVVQKARSGAAPKAKRAKIGQEEMQYLTQNRKQLFEKEEILTQQRQWMESSRSKRISGKNIQSQQTEDLKKIYQEFRDSL